MNIKETIRAEIRQRIKKYGKLADAAWGKDDPFAAETNEKIVSELQDLIVFTYSLPEQPVEGLEEAANNHIRRVVDAAGHPGWDWETQDIADAFKAGAEWMKSKSEK